MEQGTVLEGKYRLIAVIGQGGMGAVWRAQHLGLDSPVAVKVMTPEMAAHPEAMARFTREARAAASLRSPHVVQILDYGVDPAKNEPFIVMELLEGESLKARIEKRGHLPLQETARVIQQVARALTLAHAAQIVHRDLKPDNIFLVRNADDDIVKVLDFGIAKSGAVSPGMQAQTVTGSVLGTPYYMSPEQITNSKSVDHRSDLWSLSVIACECLTGQRPFSADTAMSLAVLICQGHCEKPSSLGPVPRGFDEWFARGISLARERRFQSASELSDALSALLEVRPVASAAVSPLAAAATLQAPLSEQAARSTPATAAALAAAPLGASVGPLSRTASAVVSSPAPPAAQRPKWFMPAIAGGLAALAAGSAVWVFTRSEPQAADFETLPSSVEPAAQPAPRLTAPEPAPSASARAAAATAPKISVVSAPPKAPAPAEPPQPTSQTVDTAAPAPEPRAAAPRARTAASRSRVAESRAAASKPVRAPSRVSEPASSKEKVQEPARTPPAAPSPAEKGFDPYDAL